MKKPAEVLSIFDKYSRLVDSEIKSLLAAQQNYLMYQMMSYFMGYLDENLEPSEEYGGKRFRPGLCLLLADFYGTKENAVELATSVEIFHNFTLIHDDIADGDLLRRGKPTVWSKWGINHGINTGDAQLILAFKELDKLAERNPELASKAQRLCHEKYLEVAEGQFLDFTYSETNISDPMITEENTLDMLGRKSGILVGLPAMLAGHVASVDEEEIKRLWEFGYNLGLAYQLYDDIVSIWGSSEESGKDELMDIVDKKKTLPIIYLYRNADDKVKKILETLYSKKEPLDAQEVKVVKTLLDENGTRGYIERKAQDAVKIVISSIAKLSLDATEKSQLENIVYALLPDARRVE